MSEADFEREATQLFQNLGLALGKDSLDFFQSDNAHKSDWKSSIRQPGPSPPRHRRPRKGSRGEKINAETVKEHDKQLNGSNRDVKRPAVLSAPPRSPHGQRRQNKALAGEKHLHFATSSTINGNGVTTDHQKSEPLQSPIPAVKHSPPQRKKPTVSKDANSSTQTHTPPVQNGSYISVHENPATEIRRRSLPVSNTKVIYSRKPSLQILSVTTSSRSILQTVKDRGTSEVPELPSSQQSQSLLGENTHEFDRPRVLNAPRSSLRKAKGAGKVDYSTSPAVQNGNHVYDRLSSPEAVGQFSKSQYDRLSSPEAVEQSSKSQYDRLSSPEAVGQFAKLPYNRLSSPEAIKQSSKSPEELTMSPNMSQPPSVEDSNHIYDRLSSPEATGRSSQSPEYLSVTGRRPHPIVYSRPGSRNLHVASPSPPINEVAQNGTRRKTSIEAAKEWSPEIAGSGILSETSTERSTPVEASLDERSVSTPTDDQRSSPEYSTSASERQTPDSELRRDRSSKKLTRKPSFERPSALPTMSSLASNTVQALSNLMEVLTPSVEKLDQVHFWENVEDLPVYPQSDDTENEGFPASSGGVTSPWYIDPEDMDPYEFLESQIAGLTRIVDATSPTEITGPTLVTASTGGANPPGTSSPTAGPTSSIHQPGCYAARLTSPTTEHGVTSPASLTSPRGENGVTSPASLTSPRGENRVTSPASLTSPRGEKGVTNAANVTSPTVEELPSEEQEEGEEDSDDEFFGYCARCDGAVIGMENGCLAVGSIYHMSCFTCSRCHMSLEGENFYTVNNEILCESDYLTTLDKCCACKQRIKDRILNAFGRSYHPNCFKCAVCGMCLDGVPYTSDTSQRVYCIQDFHRMFAPRCAACGLPIVPHPGKAKSLRVIAMDKSFHVDCYKCEDCCRQLAGQGSDGEKCYPLDGHLLCKSCNTMRVTSTVRTTVL